MKLIQAHCAYWAIPQVFPFIAIFTTEELADSLTYAGFELDYKWQPGKGKAVFIVAKKPA